MNEIFIQNYEVQKIYENLIEGTKKKFSSIFENISAHKHLAKNHTLISRISLKRLISNYQ